jgi:hypothetical protein
LASHIRQALISCKMRDKDTRRALQFCYFDMVDQTSTASGK